MNEQDYHIIKFTLDYDDKTHENKINVFYLNDKTKNDNTYKNFMV